MPLDADYVFDVRVLPNPHYIRELRPLTGRDAPVAAYLAAQPEVGEMLAQIEAFLARWLPAFEDDQRSYLTVAIGCTGGQHRSVYFAERLAAALRAPRGHAGAPPRARRARLTDVDRDATADARPLPLFPLQTVLFPGGAAAAEGVRGALPRPGRRSACASSSPSAWSRLRSGARGRRAATAVRFETHGMLAELIDVDSAQAGILQRALPRHAALRARGAPRSRPTACGSADVADAAPTTTVVRARAGACSPTVHGAGRRDRAR